MIALEDMAGLTEDEVKAHIADEYAGDDSGFDYGSPAEEQKAELLARLQEYDMLVAYESVGSWGCDSSSWFLMRHKQAGTLHTISGSHCSCFGFEGQGEIDLVEIEYLKSDRFYMPLGGYDEHSDENKRAVAEFIAALPA